MTDRDDWRVTAFTTAKELDQWEKEAEKAEAENLYLQRQIERAADKITEVENERDSWKEIAQQSAKSIEALRSEKSRVHVTNEMVLRFMNTFDNQLDGTKPAPSLNHFTASRTSVTRAALIDVLTESALPEWASAPAVLARIEGTDREVWVPDSRSGHEGKWWADGQWANESELIDVTPLYPEGEI